jgi:hypothetical protein
LAKLLLAKSRISVSRTVLMLATYAVIYRLPFRKAYGNVRQLILSFHDLDQPFISSLIGAFFGWLFSQFRVVA